jgi:hypothetical protein
MPQLLLTNANPLAGTNQERALSDRKNDTPTPAILPDELARMIDTTTVDRGKHNDVDIHLAPCTVKDGEGDRLSPIRNRQHWSPTCWPELLSLLAWPWAIEAGSIESILRSAGCILLTPLAIRACWNIAILLHGIGHTLLIAVVDRKGSALNINNITEHQNLNELSRSLIPFQSINSPFPRKGASLWLDAGDQEASKIRIKASGGLLMNGFAVAAAMTGLKVAAMNMAHHNQDPLFWPSTFILLSLLVSNGVLLACSRTDWIALLTGEAACFYCGNFGFIAEQDDVSANELLSRRGIERFQIMGQETEVRGEQAGGALVLARDRSGHVRFVGHKVVNKKRRNLTHHLESTFARKRHQAIRAGYRPLGTCTTAAWHYRFGTSGPPAVLETHWHEWCPARIDRVWLQINGRWTATQQNINHRITHNGDFDGFLLFDKVVDYEKLGLWLERVLHVPNKTVGDSPKIAGMMDLLTCKGNWYAAVRLGYQMAIARDVSASFGGQAPCRSAPQTAPSPTDLKNWAAIFEDCFLDFAQRHPSIEWEDDPSTRQQLQDKMHEHLRRDSCLSMNSEEDLRTMIDEVILSFLYNSCEQANRLFLAQARGSFGLVTLSTLTPNEVVLGCLGQPLSTGFDPDTKLSLFASEPASIDAALALNPQAYRIDLNQNSGEVAVLTSCAIKVYSLSDMRTISSQEILERKVFYKTNSGLQPIRPSTQDRKDPVAADLRDIPGLLNTIRSDWVNPSSLNRQSADYFINILIAKAYHLQEKQALLQASGLDPSLAKSTHVDILITGMENSLWVGAQFAKDLETVFPLLTIKTLSSNQVLQSLQHDFDSLGLARQTVVIAISQSGQTFSTRQVMEACDLLVREEVIREIFMVTGEPTSFVGSSMMKPTFAGEPFSRRMITTSGGRRTAEPATASVAALHHTLTELLFCVCRQIQVAFPQHQPFGMKLSIQDLFVLEGMEDHLFLQSVVNITGTDCQRDPKPSRLYQQLVEGGHQWGLHVVEYPIAWAIQALYVAITVGWAIPFGHPIPPLQTIGNSLIQVFNLNANSILIHDLSVLLALADLVIYIFGPWFWTLGLRLAQGRQVLARTGKRTLVIGDTPWVHQVLCNFVSKLFSLSYGVASIEVHGTNPQDDLVHCYAHRVVRGTLVYLGIPDGRFSEMQNSQELATIMAGRQSHGIQHLSTDPEILMVGSNPSIEDKGFGKAIILPSQGGKAWEEIGSDDPSVHVLESLRESRFGSFLRLLSSYIYFWSMAKTVASLPLLKYEFWKSQSRTKVMTTAAPVSAAKLDRPERAKVNELHLSVYANRDQS